MLLERILVGGPTSGEKNLFSSAAEPSMAINVETRAAFYRFLRGIVEAGYGDRVMFGSDQIIWPELIDVAVRSIEDASFLTPKQKRDIFYNNAARF